MRVWRAAVVAAVVVVGVGVGAPASAAPPDSSAVEVGDTSLAAGDTFTITQEVHNPLDFTLTDGFASIGALADVVDLVSCTGATCGEYETSFRGHVGDLPYGATRVVVFTFRVEDDVAAGTHQWTHQLGGSNYAFEALPGPALTVTTTPADLRVGLTATPRGLLAPRLDYAITVRNDGPADATGVRITGTYAAGLGWVGSSDCGRSGRTITCDVASIPAGQTRTLRFSTSTGLLSLGAFTTTAQRAQSTPADPNPANDRASRTCTALTGLIVVC